MTMVFAFKHWEHYLMGSHTIAYTDSSFLKFLNTLKTPSPRVVRWIADMSLYIYEVRHIHGSTDTAADDLPRMYPEESLALLKIDVSPDWTDAIGQTPPFWSSVTSRMDNSKRTGDSHGMAVVFGLETIFWSQPRSTMLSSPRCISP